eukprot:1159136-Pelagomonas_calceolata.AAC.2
MTSEGSVASDAEKLAELVLPDTEVALICSAWGKNRTYPAAGHALFTHACIAGRAPCKLLLPFIAYCRLSLYNQQRTIHQRLPHPHTRVGVQVLLHVASANFRAFTSLFTQQLTTSLEQVRLRSPRNRSPPSPGPGRGIHIKYADKVCVNWSCSGGLDGSN